MKNFLIGVIWTSSLSAMVTDPGDHGQPLLMTVLQGVMTLVRSRNTERCLQIERTHGRATAWTVSLPRQYGTLPGQSVCSDPLSDQKRDRTMA